jgi:hypothetical protein
MVICQAVRKYGDAESVRGRRPRPPVMKVPKKALSLSLSPTVSPSSIDMYNNDVGKRFMK